MAQLREIAELRRLMARMVTSYAGSGMVALGEGDFIDQGRGFFPYGNGLWVGDGEAQAAVFPKGGIMVLGQDFGTQSYLHRLRHGGESLSNPTWRNLGKLFSTALASELPACFFTNAIMGVRATGEPIMGKAPPFRRKYQPRGEAFLNECRDFLVAQVATQAPKLILCLGKTPRDFLNHPRALGDQVRRVSGSKSYNVLTEDEQLWRGVSIGGVVTTVLLIVHPSTPNRTNVPSILAEQAIIARILEEMSNTPSITP